MSGARPEPGLVISYAYLWNTATVRRHLRLDDDRCWIVLAEWNEFVWPGPDLGHSAPGDTLIYEKLPPRFFERIRQRFIAAVKAGKAAAVKRTDV